MFTGGKGGMIRAPAMAVPAMSLASAVRKLTNVLVEENECLASNRINSHGTFTRIKNEALRELMAAQESGCSEDVLMARHGELTVLKRLLARNAGLLKTHIGALGEVTDIIIGGLRAAESDGTYSRRGALG